MTRSPKTERLLQAKRKFAEKPVLRRETTWQFLGLIAFVIMNVTVGIGRGFARSDYETVKWILLSVIGAEFFVFILGVVLVCVIALTGPVYKNRIDFKRAELEVWNWEDKTVAAIILTLVTVGTAFVVKWAMF